MTAYPLSEKDDSITKEEPFKGSFIQVDVTIASDKTKWMYYVFTHAHGDLFAILGSIVRTYGLSLNDHGLHLRVPGLDSKGSKNRKNCMILLTADHHEILEFLGLDVKRWSSPFATQQQLFEYAASTSLFTTKSKALATTDATKASDEDGKKSSKTPTALTDEEAPARSYPAAYDDKPFTLDSNTNPAEARPPPAPCKSDRRKAKLREMFRAWIEDFVVEAHKSGKYNRDVPTREEMAEKCFAWFGDGVKKEYDTRLFEYRNDLRTDQVWQAIVDYVGAHSKSDSASTVPVVEHATPSTAHGPAQNKTPATATAAEEAQLRNASLRALKTIIYEPRPCQDHSSLGSLLRDDEGLLDLNKCLEFVQEEWRNVVERQLEIERVKAGQPGSRKNKNKKKKKAGGAAQTAGGEDLSVAGPVQQERELL
jgi:hypothetical protein